jgi:predicted RNA-binding Zn-ribbon protein involved in translation (DUF1610 family)
MNDTDIGEDQASDANGDELPGVERVDGELTATTDGGERIYVARDEEESGSEGAFLATYEDAQRTVRYGFYCSNCGSLAVSMGETEEIECPDCGNSHASRGGRSDDDSYL